MIRYHGTNSSLYSVYVIAYFTLSRFDYDKVEDGMLWSAHHSHSSLKYTNQRNKTTDDVFSIFLGLAFGKNHI